MKIADEFDESGDQYTATHTEFKLRTLVLKMQYMHVTYTICQKTKQNKKHNKNYLSFGAS
jgi:hypothetical protein